MSSFGHTFWLTGLSGAGKTWLAQHLQAQARTEGQPVVVLDGDALRAGMNRDLGFSEADRREHIRRCAALAQTLAAQGLWVVVSLISPYRAQRCAIAQAHRDAGLGWMLVYVDTPLALCEQADPKGLYQRARRGEVTQMVGLDLPYEAPDVAEAAVSVSPWRDSATDAVAAVMRGMRLSRAAGP